MKNIFYFSALLLLIFSCSNNTSEVQLSYTNLEGIVPKQGNFTFDFDEELAPDSIQGIWQKENYVKFTPKMEGEFKWISSSELIFSPLFD